MEANSNITYKEINVMDASFESCYLDRNKEFIISLLFDDFLCNEAYEVYLVNKKNTTTNNLEKYFIIRYQIPVNLKDKIYNVPVLIHLPKTFPESVPDIYIERTSEIAINPKYAHMIDLETFKIDAPFLKTWGEPNSTIQRLVESLFVMFQKEFPVYQLPKNQHGKRNQFLNINCTLPTKDVYRVTATAASKVVDKPVEAKNPFIKPAVSNPINNNNNNNNIIKNNNVNNNANTNKNIKDNNNQINETEIRKLVINELHSKITQRIIQDKINLLQINQELQTTRQSLINETEKIIKLVEKKDDIIKTISSLSVSVENQIKTIKEELSIINDNKNNTEENNIINLVRIDNKKVVELIAVEATIDDLLKIARRAFEKHLFTFQECIKYTRDLSRELLKVKFYRNKLQMQV